MDISLRIDALQERSYNVITNMINKYKELLYRIKSSNILINPINMYNVKMQILNMEKLKLNKCFTDLVTEKHVELFKLKNNYILQNPRLLYEKYINILELDINKLELLNPLNSLKRGYAIVKKNNKCIESIKKIKIDDKINISLKNGTITGVVTEVKEDL